MIIMDRDRCVVRCENTGTELVIVKGTTFKEVLQYLPVENKEQFIAAYVNNRSQYLNYTIYNNVTVRYITPAHFEGSRVYRRTIMFMLHKAVRELYPDKALKVEFSVGRGAYFEIVGGEPNVDYSTILKEKLLEYIKSDIEIKTETIHFDDLIKYYRENNLNDKIDLIDSLNQLYYTVNIMGDDKSYFYGTLASSTSQITLFDIVKYHNGYAIVVPKRTNLGELEELPSSQKIYDVFVTHKKWINILNIESLGKLNKRIDAGDADDLVKIAEALHEKTMSNLADKIYEQYQNGARVVMISGPSSSGKTTSSYRLSIQLRVLGLKPIIIGMDNYFVNREDTPLDDKGRYNFESLGAIDIQLFNKQINDLINGEEVDIPKYDFVSGTRQYIDNRLKLEKNSIIIIEGIHALNPASSESIDREKIFKIYVSPMTSMSLDNTSYLSTTDNRLIRRMVRDYQFRGTSALDTLKRWGSVRAGEEKHILPYQDEADFQFNSALFYEIGVLRSFIEPLLREVPRNTQEYSEALRLRRLLEHFRVISSKIVPSTSLLKEFIGGSSFNIK